jgi:hypothetical protein
MSLCALVVKSSVAPRHLPGILGLVPRRGAAHRLCSALGLGAFFPLGGQHTIGRVALKTGVLVQGSMRWVGHL